MTGLWLYHLDGECGIRSPYAIDDGSLGAPLAAVGYFLR
ncbi:hypothetical protein C8K18_12372 [Paraburkholderia sp. GV068]|nr:hypothetical protein C8K19_12372 [Paraburkholderia sp. GV072]PUA94330.1 hypothetical protein C8K18_12372 [Paraburkholderia sp. GV068]